MAKFDRLDIGCLFGDHGIGHGKSPEMMKPGAMAGRVVELSG